MRGPAGTRHLAAVGLAAAAILCVSSLSGTPASAEADPLLKRAIAGFVPGAEVLRIDAVPDLYEGGYARISFYARRPRMQGGALIIDESWVRLRGATLNVAAFRQGVFRVESVRSSSIYMRVAVRSMEQYFAAYYRDIRLWSDGAAIYGTGTVPLFNHPTRVEMKGAFAVDGTKALFFFVEQMRVSGIPLPDGILRMLERQFNPILTQQDWPVIFAFRSVRQTREDVYISSERDPYTCTFCADTGP